VNLPDALVDLVENAKSKEDIREIGVQWCIQQARELKAAGVPGLHFYTMGKTEPTARIAREIF